MEFEFENGISEYSSLIPKGKDIYVRLIGDLRMGIHVNVRVKNSLSLCVNPATDAELGVPMTAGIGSCDLE